MVFVKTKSNLGKVETKSKRQLQTKRTQHQSQNVHIHIHKDDKPKPKRKRNTKPKPTNNYGRYDREASIYSQTNSPYEDMMAQNRALKPTINYTIPAQQQALALMTNKNNDLITEFLQNNNKKPLALPPSEPTNSPLLHTTKKKPMILPPDTPAQYTQKEINDYNEYKKLTKEYMDTGNAKPYDNNLKIKSSENTPQTDTKKKNMYPEERQALKEWAGIGNITEIKSKFKGQQYNGTNVENLKGDSLYFMMREYRAKNIKPPEEEEDQEVIPQPVKKGKGKNKKGKNKNN